ncbi:MAG: hypothetical protein HQ569_01985 [Actinobacteria bacterium]|nr:hypothetical protein [Actinomycetota bacterium]
MGKVPTHIKGLRDFLKRISDNEKLLYSIEFDTSFKNYLNYMTKLYKEWFPKAKLYSDEHIAEKLFVKEVSIKDIKHYIKYQLFALIQSCKRIYSSINTYKKDIKNQPQLFDELGLIMEISFETIVFLDWGEYYIKGKQANYGCIKRNVLYSIEIFSASKMILRKRLYEKSLGSFVVRPTSVFLLRQSIEIRLKNAFGIETIYYKDGKIYKKRVGELLFKLLKDAKDYIDFPIKISILEKIYKWTNYYIHNGLIPNTWEIEWAQYILEPLFSSGINCKTRSLYGSIKIKKIYYDKVETKLKQIVRDKDIVVQRLNNPESLITK